jgi:hypothetical protein
VKPTYNVGYSLCTCKYVEERRKGVTHARMHSLASPRLTGHSVAWRDDGRGRTMCM